MPEEGIDRVSLFVGQETPTHGLRTRFTILVVVISLALAYMIYAAFPGNALYFLTVGEFLEKESINDGRTLRVSGVLVDGSFHREANSIQSRFQLKDKDGGLVGEFLAATYAGVLPDLFFNPHSEVILQGRYGPDQVFETDAILVKCPSKYKSLEDELQDSIDALGGTEAPRDTSRETNGALPTTVAPLLIA